MQYTYDSNGNLKTRKDARNITTTYYYDALSRLTQKSYSDATPTAAFLYDDASCCPYFSPPLQYTTGRMVYSTAGHTITYYGYDPMGRPKYTYQAPPVIYGSSSYGISYGYNLIGDRTSYNDGVGHTFTQTFNAAARLTQITSSLNDSQHPGTLLTVDSSNGYWPAGQIRKVTFGNNLTGTMAFNNRLQPCRINVNSSSSLYTYCTDPLPTGNVQDFNYGYNWTSSDNGNVMSWSATGISGTQSFSKAYTYDQLNRLATMSGSGGSCTGLSWTYDTWGNRTDQSYTGGTCNTSHLGFDSNNRLNSPSGFTYDAAGNLLGDGTYTYSYDAEERLISVGGLSSASYVYDAMGRRVQRTVGSSSAYYLYDLGGNITSDILPSGGDAADYIFAGGQLVAQYASGTTYFVHQDHLGSTRLLTGVSGTVQDCYAFYPFGETDTTICTPTYNALDRFTGFRFDPETNLYDTLSRKFTSAQGRFLSPDDPRMDQQPSDPQSWNLYIYVRNNPLRNTDPTGHACVGDANGGWKDDDSGGQSCAEANDPKNNDTPSTVVTDSQQAGLSPMPSPGPSIPPPLAEPAPVAVTEVMAGTGAVSTAAIVGLVAVDVGLAIFDGIEAYKLYRSYKDSQVKPAFEPTPKTNGDIFENVRGTPAKRNKITGEIWEKDKFHENHYEIYKNKKDYDNGRRDRSVWDDGRPKEKF